MSDEDGGLDLKLLAAIPVDARRVLQIGCANGGLGCRFKELHPAAEWWSVDLSREAIAAASPWLDRAVVLDIDRDGLASVGQDFDVVVIGDLTEHLRQPGATLQALHDLTTPGACIVCGLPSSGHLSLIHRMVAGDLGHGDDDPRDKKHAGFVSPSSAIKTLLDAGWLPHLHDRHRIEAPTGAFASRIFDAAAALGLPPKTAYRHLGLYQMILVCPKWPMQALAQGLPPVPFSVIVPINRPWQYELNVGRSPGLREVAADVVCVRDAANAAQAYALGAERATHPWRLLAHQDVYFPVGSGFAIARQLAALQHDGLDGAPVGFAGIDCGDDGRGEPRHAGLLIDRGSLFRHPRSATAISIDEFAVALHRDSPLAIDPALGWHLWATDLCLQAHAIRSRPVGQVLEAPLFHNSTTAHELPESFHQSASRLLAKYPQWPRIATLHGSICRPVRDEGRAVQPGSASVRAALGVVEPAPADLD